MSKKLMVSFVLLLLGLTGFFLRFGSVDGFAASWHAFANGNMWVPFTPYDSRIEKASKLKRVEATRILIDDHSLFWKGTGAMVEPRLGEDDELVQLKVISGGYGYSSSSAARFIGARSHRFQPGPVTVREGRVVAVSILKTGRWYNSSRVFFGEEELPFSGTTEIRYRNGQLLESR